MSRNILILSFCILSLSSTSYGADLDESSEASSIEERSVVQRRENIVPDRSRSAGNTPELNNLTSRTFYVASPIMTQEPEKIHGQEKNLHNISTTQEPTQITETIPQLSATKKVEKSLGEKIKDFFTSFWVCMKDTRETLKEVVAAEKAIKNDIRSVIG